MTGDAERSGSSHQRWRYQNNAASRKRRFRRRGVFFTGWFDPDEEHVFDPETLREQYPDLDKARYEAYLLDHFGDCYFQNVEGIRVRPCRVDANMYNLNADVIGCNVDEPAEGASHLVGTMEEGGFRLEGGWARLHGPDDRIPVLPRYEAITEKILRAGFLPRHLAKRKYREASFAVREYDEHVVVFTYRAVLEEGYLQRLREVLLQGGVKSEEGLSRHCKLESVDGKPDEMMLVIGVY